MFEFLFKYPASVFSRGHLCFWGRGPVGFWSAGILSACRGDRNRHLEQTEFAAGEFSRLACGGDLGAAKCGSGGIAFASLGAGHQRNGVKPQQNIIAVLVDDSRSMSLSDGGSGTRQEQAEAVAGERRSEEAARTISVAALPVECWCAAGHRTATS